MPGCTTVNPESDAVGPVTAAWSDGEGPV